MPGAIPRDQTATVADVEAIGAQQTIHDIEQAVIVEQRIEDVGVLLDERLHILAARAIGAGPARQMGDHAHERLGVVFNLVWREELWKDDVAECLEKKALPGKC